MITTVLSNNKPQSLLGKQQSIRIDSKHESDDWLGLNWFALSSAGVAACLSHPVTGADTEAQVSHGKAS